jgi:hypothetical protein
MALRTIGSSLALGLALALAAPARASQLIPRTLTELAAGSDLIFVGRCEAVSSHWNADHTLILTASRFRVSRIIKGQPGDSITLEELGGTVGDTTLHVSDVPRYAVGEELLLCVHRTPLGRWETFGAGQGRFEIVHDARSRIWARNDYYRSQLAGMAPGERAARGAPLATLAGRLSAVRSLRGARQ